MDPLISSRSLLKRIIGHEAIIVELSELVARRAVPHALLFTGPAGVGKRTVARAFAALLLSDDAHAAECERLLDKGAHPDYHVVARESGKKDLTVESIRELCAALQLKPYYGHSSVAVVDNAHEMNIAASNALLTTLEEPNAGNYIILVTDAPQRLPETIVSRCQQFHFGELDQARIATIVASAFGEVLDSALCSRILLSLGGSTSLAPLSLDGHIDLRTLKPLDVKQLTNHLNQLLDEREKVQARLKLLFGGDTSIGSGDAVALASELAAEKETGSLVWLLLSEGVREKMRKSEPKQSGAWAQIFLELLECQKLTHERSLNPQLQFTSLCLKIAQTR